MTATLVAVALLVTATLYVTFGGADFGAGFWNLLAARDPGARRLIAASVTPVWESNHVWLVFGLVLFFTGFPAASASVWTVAAPALWLALLGIVLRGAAFAFLATTRTPGLRRLLNGTFAASSIVTPFCMGWAIGLVVSGHGWYFAPACGVLFVAAGAYLAAAYLVREARETPELERYFAVRAQWAGVVTGLSSIVCLVVLHTANARLADRLLGRALPLTALAAACGLAVVVRLFLHRTRGVRILAWTGIAAVVGAWGTAQYPVVVPRGGFTLAGSAAPEASLRALLVVAVLVVVLVVPSFLLLFSLQNRGALSGDDPPPG
ncbi:cytochrome d ubiquinol oxidase subunit II [Winogradskya consettensis]|uniref:Cytochrome D ubiquinol oxidase subunit II n=1 Tax=Winogradskya consettensis TaxID=113560 RepID=A0A919SWN9_9ACTN|nr:cytochrome d ubiquinol oxidase subunit II [Actinoplanes consettensis]GIM79867.1 cytochrome D ubiquinol oxidase subunit II [Actinoplanes consettensis]